MNATKHGIVVARADAVAPGSARHVKAAGRGIALFNVGGAFYATDDSCTHMRARLSAGHIEGEIVQCPVHFGRFNIRTGKACGAPCTVDLRIYEVRRAGDDLTVILPEG